MQSLNDKAESGAACRRQPSDKVVDSHPCYTRNVVVPNALLYQKPAKRFQIKHLLCGFTQC